jgi:hypothetical protein
MAITAPRRLFIAEFAIGRTITIRPAIFVPIVALLAKFDDAIPAYGWVGVAAVVDEGTVFGTMRTRSSVQITVITLFWELQNCQYCVYEQCRQCHTSVIPFPHTQVFHLQSFPQGSSGFPFGSHCSP